MIQGSISILPLPRQMPSLHATPLVAVTSKGKMLSVGMNIMTSSLTIVSDVAVIFLHVASSSSTLTGVTRLARILPNCLLREMRFILKFSSVASREACLVSIIFNGY